ncbi:MAG: hypothetical protein AB1512_22335 [Thermodesulfobacteriota bacterium]
MKTSKPNPAPEQGSRNVYCPHYSECLDKVIKRGWTGWHCHLCGERFNQAAEPELALSVGESFAYYDLAAAHPGLIQ